MAYDPDKDIELKAWRFTTGLQVSVNQYAGGEPKLRIGPRFLSKADGGETPAKAGSLTLTEVRELGDILAEITQVLVLNQKG